LNSSAYDAEEDMLQALERKEIEKGDVSLIRYEGPKGGPGRPEMLTRPLRLWERDWGRTSRC
jgi:dihydroxy-acid dehydratase